MLPHSSVPDGGQKPNVLTVGNLWANGPEDGSLVCSPSRCSEDTDRVREGTGLWQRDGDKEIQEHISLRVCLHNEGT